MSSREQIGELIAAALMLPYLVDRAMKLLAVVSFFARRRGAVLEQGPSVSLIQPITRGASGLSENLRARLRLEYPGALQHIFVCDREDRESESAIQCVLKSLPEGAGEIVCVESASGIASKITKMQAGVRQARGELICFMDDDVAPRPDNLSRFVLELNRSGAAGVFGLACYTNWSRPGSALMSGFVNANALFAYIPLACMTPPFTITGHFFAIRREAWEAAGGLNGLDPARNDDDHEIARRIRKSGRTIAQSDAIYNVNNALPGLGDYNRQMKRWAAFMRIWCWPTMSGRERAVSLVNMAGNLIPMLLLLVALGLPGRTATACILGVLMINIRLQASFYGGVLQQPFRPVQLPCLISALLFAPYQMLLSPLWGNIIEWRGQRFRVLPEGLLERLE